MAQSSPIKFKRLLFSASSVTWLFCVAASGEEQAKKEVPVMAKEKGAGEGAGAPQKVDGGKTDDRSAEELASASESQPAQLSPATPGAPSGNTVPGSVAPEAVPGDVNRAVPKSALPTQGQKKAEGGLVDPLLFDPLAGDNAPERQNAKKSSSQRAFPKWRNPALSEMGLNLSADAMAARVYFPDSDEIGVRANSEPPPEPTPLVVPSLYGRAPNVLLMGQGRLAFPWTFHYGFSIDNGYDSNSFQVPDTTLTNITGEAKGSFTTGIGAHMDLSWTTAHSVLTFDASVLGTYYWNRDSDRSVFNIPTFSLLYSTKLEKYTQFTVNLSLNYLSQADYANVYASQSGGGADYLTLNSQFDLTHQWAPHFSTDSSLAVSLLYYPSGSNIAPTAGSTGVVNGNQLDITFGNQFRFQTSKWLTWVVEGRYGLQEVLEDSSMNSNTIYMLAGVDWIWFKYASAALRLGATARNSETYGTNTSPYVELSGDLKTGKYSSVRLNSRYGLEFTDLEGNDAPSFRIGLEYRQVLGKRFSGNAGVDYVHYGSGGGLTVGGSSDTVELKLGLQYMVSKHFAWDAKYVFTQYNASLSQQDYNRNQATISARWNF